MIADPEVHDAASAPRIHHRGSRGLPDGVHHPPVRGQETRHGSRAGPAPATNRAARDHSHVGGTIAVAPVAGELWIVSSTICPLGLFILVPGLIMDVI